MDVASCTYVNKAIVFVRSFALEIHQDTSRTPLWSIHEIDNYWVYIRWLRTSYLPDLLQMGAVAS